EGVGIPRLQTNDAAKGRSRIMPFPCLHQRLTELQPSLNMSRLLLQESLKCQNRFRRFASLRLRSRQCQQLPRGAYMRRTMAGTACTILRFHNRLPAPQASSDQVGTRDCKGSDPSKQYCRKHHGIIKVNAAAIYLCSARDPTLRAAREENNPMPP